jgi:hypothetical protein
MSLSKAERSAINRANASHSTGPKEGKIRSRQNALKHGLTARQLTLPDDDAAEVQALLDRWNDHYDPQAPDQEHLVEQCVAAALLQKRVTRSHVAAVVDQVNRAELELEQRGERQLLDLVALLRTTPKEAVLGLGYTAKGVAYLLGRWEHLGRALREKGWWSSDEEAEALRLMGFPPQDRWGHDAADAWSVGFDNAVCRYGPDERRLAHLLDPNRSPASMRDRYKTDGLPAREECLNRLTGLVDENLALLNGRLDLVRTVAESETANARERALTLSDERQARLMIRYQSEARLAFHRSLDALKKSLKEGVGEGSEGRDSMAESRAALAEPVAHEMAPEPAPAEPAKVEPRNEPKPAATPVAAKPSAAGNRPPAPGRNVDRLINLMDDDPFRSLGGVSEVSIPIYVSQNGPKKG